MPRLISTGRGFEGERMADAEGPCVGDGAAARLLARFTEWTVLRRLARSPILSVYADVPQRSGIHWTIDRKPWRELGAPARSVSMAPWVMAWETLWPPEPVSCAAAEQRALVRDEPA